MFEQLWKSLFKQTTSCLLEQVFEKLKSSEWLLKQIRSNKLCRVSGLTNLQHFVILWWRLTSIHLWQRVETTKREMFSQKIVRRFVGDSSAFVSDLSWAPCCWPMPWSIPSGISSHFLIFPGGDCLCLRHWLRTLRPWRITDECWRITDESPYAFSYLPVSLCSLYSFPMGLSTGLLTARVFIRRFKSV